jgi:N-acetylglucosamine kinase-like BadF-type ATPase/predicted transcriptional regulator
MLKHELVYEVIKDECRKQYVLGEIKGIDAKTVATQLNMHRSNVVKHFKKLMDMKLIYKREGRPVLYYVDLSTIEYEVSSLKDKESIYNNIDKFLEIKAENLITKGFDGEEIQNKVTNELKTYIKNYFKVIESRNRMRKIVDELVNVEYVIGVDGGGSKTEAIAYDLRGNKIAEGIAGFGNIVVNKEEGLKNIEISILKCLKNLDESKCIHIYAGLAGADTGNNKEVIKSYIEERFPISVTVVSDADLAINAMLKGKDGILTISGTGSISYAKRGNENLRVGGWGNILGDEGSGYFIAVEALKKIVNDKDDGKEFSYLSKKILEDINVKDIPSLVKFVYSSNKGDIAALVPNIVKAAKLGDEDGIDILKKAGFHLARNTYKAYKLLNLDKKVDIAIKGSIITKIDFVKESFINELNNLIKGYNLVDEDVSSTKGAYYMHLKRQ